MYSATGNTPNFSRRLPVVNYFAYSELYRRSCASLCSRYPKCCNSSVRAQTLTLKQFSEDMIQDQFAGATIPGFLRFVQFKRFNFRIKFKNSARVLFRQLITKKFEKKQKKKMATLNEVIRYIFVYLFAFLPILGFYLSTKYTNDYGLILLIDIIIFHYLVPAIFVEVQNTYVSVEDGLFSEINQYCDRAGYTLLILCTFAGGFFLLHFSGAGKYESIECLFPKFSNEVLSVLYAIFVGLLLLLIYPQTEHKFYYGFISKNVQRESLFNVIIITIANASKWYMLFSVTVKSSTAAVWWTVIFAVCFFLMGYADLKNTFYVGTSSRNLLYLCFGVTIALYKFHVKLQHPNVTPFASKSIFH